MNFRKLKYNLLAVLSLVLVATTGATYHAQETNESSKQAKATISILDGSNTTIDPIDGTYNIEIDIYGSELGDMTKDMFEVGVGDTDYPFTDYSATDTEIVGKVEIPAKSLGDSYDEKVYLRVPYFGYSHEVEAPTLEPQRVDVNPGELNAYHAVTYLEANEFLHIRGSVPLIDDTTLDGSKTKINADGGVDVTVEVQGTNLDFLDPTKVKIKANDTIYNSDVTVNETGTMLTATHTIAQSDLMNKNSLVSLVVEQNLEREHTYAAPAGMLTADTQLFGDKKTFINIDADTFAMTIGAKQVYKPELTVPKDSSIVEGTTLDINKNVTAKDTEDGDVTSKIVVTNSDNFKGDGTDQVGTYKITYTITDSDEFVVNATRTITVTAKPTMSQPKDITITEGDTFDILANVTAKDNEDGDLTSKIVVTNPDSFKGDGTDQVGTYEITYTVTDSDGNSVSVARTITVTAKPTISQPGDITITEGDSLDILAEVTANDREDGDLTSVIVVSNPNNFKGDGTDAAGTYEITYTVTDSDGNSVSVARTITVTAVPATVVDPVTPKKSTPKEQAETRKLVRTGQSSNVQAIVIAVFAIAAALVAKYELNRKMN